MSQVRAGTHLSIIYSSGVVFEVASFESMDPSQLEFIKQLIAEAEAKHRMPAAETTNTTTNPAGVGSTHAKVSMERPAPVATPCRTDAPIPAPSKAVVEDAKTPDESENNGQSKAKLKQFWSKFFVSPEAAKAAENTTPPPASAPAGAPTPASTALDSPGTETPDEPMPPAPGTCTTAPTPAPSGGALAPIPTAPAARPDEAKQGEASTTSPTPAPSNDALAPIPTAPAARPDEAKQGEASTTSPTPAPSNGALALIPAALEARPDELMLPAADTLNPEALSRREQVRAKISKFDDLQYECLVKESVQHPWFETYFRAATPTDPEDEVEDMVNWLMWLDEKVYAPADSPDRDDDPQGICRLPTLVLGETDPAVEARPAEIPQSKPKETQPAQQTPPAVPTATVDNVRATLLRATTVDLQKSPGTAPKVPDQLQQTEQADAVKVEPTPAAAMTPAQPPNAPAVTPSEQPKDAAAAKEASQKKIRAIKGKFHRSIRSTLAKLKQFLRVSYLNSSAPPHWVHGFNFSTSEASMHQKRWWQSKGNLLAVQPLVSSLTLTQTRNMYITIYNHIYIYIHIYICVCMNSF